MANRLREVRKRRGLTQRDLARVSGVSVSLIRKIEQEDYGGIGVVALRKLAAALDVPTTVLLSAVSAREPLPGTGDLWQPLADAVADDASPQQEPEPAEQVESALTAAVRLYHSNRYADLATLLPGLVRDATQATPLLRSRVLQLAGSTLTQARQRESARVALARSLADAEAAGSALDAASAVITQCWLMLGERRFDDVRVLSEQWADQIEPKLSTATWAETSAWGWLLLRGSAATIRDNRPGEAADFMRLAQAAAIATGPEKGNYHMYFTTFGFATVAMKTVENAVIDGKPGLALDLAAKVPPGLRPTSDNRNRHLLDVTAAHLDLRRYTEAADVLHQLSVQAPAWLTAQPAAANMITQIITRRRLLTPQMRGLAETIHLPL